MSPVYRSTLGYLIASALVALLVGLAAGGTWGLGVLAAQLLVLVIYHAVNLARLGRWAANPVAGHVPEGSGPWDDVLAMLHRYERAAERREVDLAEALTRLRRAAQALPDGVLILDRADRIEWCNDRAAALLMLDSASDVGQPLSNLVREPAFRDYLAAAEHDEPVQVTRSTGLTLSLQIIPYGQEQKLVLCRDLTQAERVETMRRDFVANVSHELRTPLTVLIGFLETVRELKLDPQRVKDYLGMMGDQAARMQRIIDDLLSLSTLEAAPPPAADRVRVTPLLSRVHSEGNALSSGRHEIVLEGDPAVDLVGAESELASAFGNLVSNAIRYTPPGGKVKLVWRDSAEGASFSVQDTGPGIAAEHIPRLTERFYRVDRSRSRETGGTGLGLAIVKHAVARHQAVLEVESTPGAGSRFTVRFPRQRTARKTSDISGAGDRPAATGDSLASPRGFEPRLPP